MEPSIALVIKDFDPGFGGGERYAVSLAREFRKQGIEFVVICRHARADLQKEFSVQVLSVPRKTFSRSVDFNLAFQDFLSSRAYSCILGLTQVVGCHIYRMGGGLLSVWDKIKYPGFGGKLRKTFSWNHRLNLQLEREILEHRNLRFLVANSELVSRQVLEAYPGHRERIVLIDNAIEQDVFFQTGGASGARLEFLKAQGVPPGNRILLFAANNFERKGLFFLLEALAELKEKESFSLIVAGRGNIEEAQKKAARQGLDSRVTFLGSCANMAELYRASDLFVLPTQYDPCSNACLEALACGLPVITTDWNGAEMYLKNGAGISLSSANLKNGLKEAFVKCLNPEILALMKQNAPEAVRSLTFQRNALSMHGLIRRVIQGE